MNRIPAEIFPPGEYLKDELDARGWSQSEFAEIIGRDAATVNRIISAKAQITPEMACLFEEALDLDAQYWLNLEMAYQLGKTRLQKQKKSAVAQRAALHEKFPVKQMLNRGWIEQTDNIDVLQFRVLKYFNIKTVEEVPAFKHAAKKKRDKKKTPEQNAWLFRTRQLANAQLTPTFSKSTFQSALEVLKTMLEAPEEIRRVPAVLSKAGIRFVVVEPLKGSKIDGACYWIEDNKTPVVALSMVYPSIDCFWFNLIHELMHVANGHGKNDAILDEDLNSEINWDADEELVNQQAANWLISNQEFDDFITRYSPIFSRQNVLGFARRIRVHPGIVAGRLHKKKVIKDWAIHGKLKVNVREIVAKSALCDGWGVAPQI